MPEWSTGPAVSPYEQPLAPPLSAATRRRRTLVGLLVPTSLTALLAAIGVLPWWTFVVMVVIVVAFLGLSISIASRERAYARASYRSQAIERERYAEDAYEPVEQYDEEEGEPSVIAVLPDDFGLPPRDENSWDPVDVPLPTYVTKAVVAPPDRGQAEFDGAETVLDEGEREATGIQDDLYGHDGDDRRRAVGD